MQVPVPEPEVPAVAPPSLKTVSITLPSNLLDAVSNFDAAKRLGKALFWDQQLGSDGVACATCHFHSGADSRVKNQINPGPGDAFGQFFSGSGGANYSPKSCDFPFHRLADPVDNESPVVFDSDDRMSSAGVFRRRFMNVTPAIDLDTGEVTDDPIAFLIGSTHTRRVEPRNTPTTINAVFLHRIFWDGRANFYFNGINPFGDTDPDAKVLVKQGPNPGDDVFPTRMLFDHAALASQSVGPPNSPFEMAFDGRTWPLVGHKLATMKPLARQRVDRTDSVLGSIDRLPDALDDLQGLDQSLTYEEMIKAAFHEKFWGSNQLFPHETYMCTQLEMNFSMFFGLALLCYESTLVSDDSRYDQYMDGGGEGGSNSNILTAQEKEGLETFINQGACIACHSGAEFAGASLSTIALEGPLERMLMADGEAEGGIEFVTNPPPPNEDEPIDPHAKPYSIDPRGKLIEIRPPSGTGSPLAWGWGYFGGTSGSCSSNVDSTLVLTPGANAPANSSFAASMRMRVDSSNCGKLFKLDMSWTWPGKPGGDYTVYVGGRKVGVIKMTDVKGPAVYDVGFYNIGVRQTNEDLCNGGQGPHGPFAFAARAKAGQDVDGGRLQPPVGPTERIAVDGAFKAPSLRNIELTGPYMHNGGFATLEEVVEFYTGGSHFFRENIDNLDPEVDGIGRLKTHPERRAALVAFLKTLTDDRVRYEMAPFDHPELFVPNGHPGDELSVTPNLLACNGPICEATEDIMTLEKVGAAGRLTPIQSFDSQLAPCVQMLLAPGAQVDELGTLGAEVRVTLSSKPSSNVTVPVIVTDATEGSLAVAQLVFTPADWAAPQMVAVHGVQDGIADGNVSFDVKAGATTSTDPRFANIESTKVRVLTLDSGVVYQTISLEAELASFVAPMAWSTDATASGGKFIWTPNGNGNNLSSTATNGVATYNFNVTAAGAFRVWALVKTATSTDNEFWVKVDSNAYQAWTAPVVAAWSWDKVSSGVTDPVTWNLTPGAHSLKVRWREDGAKIDRLYITSDPAFVPATGHPVTP